jgi:hypothetical protein
VKKRRKISSSIQSTGSGIEIVLISTGTKHKCKVEGGCDPANCTKFLKCLMRAWKSVEDNSDRLTMPIVSEYIRLLREEESKLIKHIRGTVMDDIIKTILKEKRR